MTYVLLWINIFVFIAILVFDGFSYQRLVLGPKLDTLILFGAKQNGLIASWQLERLFVPMFLHANLLHLGFNMYAFTQVGRFMEMMFGARALLAAYLVGGVVGNIFSFALMPSLQTGFHFLGSTGPAVLSVGASGSLFAILLFLFVIQKYQAKLASEIGIEEPRTNLGALIIANGLISFLVPNIDWACHLGGAFAGAILGLGMSLNHAWLRKQYQAVKFMAFGDKIARPKFIHRPSTWYGALVVFCALLVFNGFRVPFSEKILGKGILAAAEEFIEERDEEYITQFANVLVHRKAETDPSHLLEGALALHNAGKFRAAQSLYLALSLLHKYKLGTADFVAPATAAILSGAFEAASREVYFPLEKPINGKSVPNFDFCEKPATTFRGLGFFVLSGLLWECAYELNPKNSQFAVNVVEAFWRSERLRLMYEFLERVDAMQVGKSWGVKWQLFLPRPESSPVLPRPRELDTNKQLPTGEEI